MSGGARPKANGASAASSPAGGESGARGSSAASGAGTSGSSAPAAAGSSRGFASGKSNYAALEAWQTRFTPFARHDRWVNPARQPVLGTLYDGREAPPGFVADHQAEVLRPEELEAIKRAESVAPDRKGTAGRNEA